MHPLLRILGIVAVFVVATVGWFVLAGVTDARTATGRNQLSGDVISLWGSPQTQAAPTFTLQWKEEVAYTRDVTNAAGEVVGSRIERRWETRTEQVDPNSTRVQVDLKLDEKRRGLLWFPLYDVSFAGKWSYVHRQAVARELIVAVAFPDSNASYDAFRFVVDGVDVGARARPSGGQVAATVHVEPDQEVRLELGYLSRGSTSWSYQPTLGVGQVEDFQLAMTTDFDDIDFQVPGRSPTSREKREEGGWTLHWDYTRGVAGYGLGMIMPTHVQPGELATSLALSAPLSLGLFFLWIYVLGLLRGREAHPINYLFVAGAFFAFNLLFAYTADHLPVEQAFALSSVVSVALVVTYLRLVLGARFAFLEAGIALLLYQVGFATAHFFDGFTGLTVTVLGILTLFALMQMTGRIDWSAALERRARPAPV